MAIGQGSPDQNLTSDDVRRLCASALEPMDLDGKRVIVIIPDSTRTAPVGLMFKTIYDLVAPRAALLDFMVALGTHPLMSEEQIYQRVEISLKQHRDRYPKARFFNHRWDLPGTLQPIGRITEDEIEELSGGLFKQEVPVAINKQVLDYDHIFIVGPTFPHEVVGFSGGNKYLFPGVSGDEVLHFFHWLGAVITNPVINGSKWTPVRKVVDKAASLVPVERTCFSLVVTYEGLKGLYVGSPEDAWSDAVDLSAQVHILYQDKPFKTVLSMSPVMYDDIWTGGKCMYKLEPALADGADLIIYAPHIDEVSYSHGKILDEIGYHVRDYFLKRFDRFRHYPWGLLAHSTHVKGIGTFEDGVEEPRCNVILATKIPEERCKAINLGYMNPDGIDPEAYKGREDEGILCVPKAGEMLYRLADGTVPRIPGDV